MTKNTISILTCYHLVALIVYKRPTQQNSQGAIIHHLTVWVKHPYCLQHTLQWVMLSHLGYFAGVTMTMVTLVAVNGQTISLGYLVTSVTRPSHPGSQLMSP